MRVAAVQMEAIVADVRANLKKARELIDEAAAADAEWIALPEFFTTGIGFVPELATAALAPDGAAAELLVESAARHGANVGGSFLCRDPDGEVRNAFLLATPDGIAGRHDKDLPTMWENSFYIGGRDDGVFEIPTAGSSPLAGRALGVALCWELMRTQTVRRLRGEVDLVVGGSGWWSIPLNWHPRAVLESQERRNHELARRAAAEFAPYVGAPVVHAAHAGTLRCRMPETGLRYEGHFEGSAMVCDAHGSVLAERDFSLGEGVVVAEVEPGRRPPLREVPNRFWLHRRGAMAATTWNTQRLHGKRWYRRHGTRPSAQAR